MLNDNLAGLKKITIATISAGETKTITHDTAARFVYLLSLQGGDGITWGSYILQGYGAGTSNRDHIITLGNGASISVAISASSPAFTVSNTGVATCECSLLVLMGNAPTIT